MLAHLRAKPGGDRVRARAGATWPRRPLVAAGRFAVVFCAYNTFFNLDTAGGPGACLAWAAAALAPGGRLAIEAFVPTERRRARRAGR